MSAFSHWQPKFTQPAIKIPNNDLHPLEAYQDQQWVDKAKYMKANENIANVTPCEAKGKFRNSNLVINNSKATPFKNPIIQIGKKPEAGIMAQLKQNAVQDDTWYIITAIGCANRALQNNDVFSAAFFMGRPITDEEIAKHSVTGNVYRNSIQARFLKGKNLTLYFMNEEERAEYLRRQAFLSRYGLGDNNGANNNNGPGLPPFPPGNNGGNNNAPGLPPFPPTYKPPPPDWPFGGSDNDDDDNEFKGAPPLPPFNLKQETIYPDLASLPFESNDFEYKANLINTIKSEPVDNVTNLSTIPSPTIMEYVDDPAFDDEDVDMIDKSKLMNMIQSLEQQSYTYPGQAFTLERDHKFPSPSVPPPRSSNILKARFLRDKLNSIRNSMIQNNNAILGPESVINPMIDNSDGFIAPPNSGFFNPNINYTTNDDDEEMKYLLEENIRLEADRFANINRLKVAEAAKQFEEDLKKSTSEKMQAEAKEQAVREAAENIRKCKLIQQQINADILENIQRANALRNEIRERFKVVAWDVANHFLSEEGNVVPYDSRYDNDPEMIMFYTILLDKYPKFIKQWRPKGSISDSINYQPTLNLIRQVQAEARDSIVHGRRERIREANSSNPSILGILGGLPSAIVGIFNSGTEAKEREEKIPGLMSAPGNINSNINQVYTSTSAPEIRPNNVRTTTATKPRSNKKKPNNPPPDLPPANDVAYTTPRTSQRVVLQPIDISSNTALLTPPRSGKYQYKRNNQYYAQAPLMGDLATDVRNHKGLLKQPDLKTRAQGRGIAKKVINELIKQIAGKKRKRLIKGRGLTDFKMEEVFGSTLKKNKRGRYCLMRDNMQLGILGIDKIKLSQSPSILSIVRLTNNKKMNNLPNRIISPAEKLAILSLIQNVEPDMSTLSPQEQGYIDIIIKKSHIKNLTPSKPALPTNYEDIKNEVFRNLAEIKTGNNSTQLKHDTYLLLRKLVAAKELPEEKVNQISKSFKLI